jgi:hypothetical protein
MDKYAVICSKYMQKYALTPQVWILKDNMHKYAKKCINMHYMYTRNLYARYAEICTPHFADGDTESVTPPGRASCAALAGGATRSPPRARAAGWAGTPGLRLLRSAAALLRVRFMRDLSAQLKIAEPSNVGSCWPAGPGAGPAPAPAFGPGSRASEAPAQRIGCRGERKLARLGTCRTRRWCMRNDTIRARVLSSVFTVT